MPDYQYKTGQKVIVQDNQTGTYVGHANGRDAKGVVVWHGVLVKLEDGRKVVFSTAEVRPADEVQ